MGESGEVAAGPSSARGRQAVRSALAVGALLAAIIVPFLLWGPAVEIWTREALGAQGAAAAALLGGVLLALDVVLPVPSSAVGILLGGALGFAGGTLVATAGLSLGCLLGYGIGRSGTRPWADGVELRGRLGAAVRRHGLLALILLRGVPVLAEASVVVAGGLGLPLRSVLVATTAANLVVSAALSAAGARLGFGPLVWIVGLCLLAAIVAAASLWLRRVGRPRTS